MVEYRVATRCRAVMTAGLVLVVLVSGCASGASGSWRAGGVAASAGASGSAAPPSPATSPSRPAPSGGPPPVYPFYVDPASAAARQVSTWRAQGRADDAQQLTKISTRPGAHWLTAPSAGTTADVSALVGRAAAVHQTPVLAVYAIPHRDCGSYSAGGAGSPAEYRTWVRAVAAGIGDHPAVVLLLPDALAPKPTPPGGVSHARGFAAQAQRAA